MDNPYKVPSIEDLLSDIDSDAPAEPERVENENFIQEEDEEETVDAMLDELFEKESY